MISAQRSIRIFGKRLRSGDLTSILVKVIVNTKWILSDPVPFRRISIEITIVINYALFSDQRTLPTCTKMLAKSPDLTLFPKIRILR